MTRVWAVAVYEYARHVWRRRFVFAVLSIPAFVALTVGTGILAAQANENLTPVGYVDRAGVLDDPRPAPPDPDLPYAPLVAYPAEAGARAALDAGTIQAYYVLAPDYPTSGRVSLVYYKPPSRNARVHVTRFLQANLLAAQPPAVAARALAGPQLTLRAATGGRTFSATPTLNQFLPLLVGAAFFTLIFVVSGYILQAVSDEKENRTMEILVTSLSAGKLLAGKLLGVAGIGLTLTAVWGGLAALAVGLGGRVAGLEWLRDVQLDLGTLLPIMLILAPAFVLVAGLMAALGATVVEAQEAQQMTGLVVLPFTVPIYLVVPLMEYPHSPLAVGLTLFPITAPLTLVIRATFTNVPAWQVAASAGIMTLAAAGAVWLAGRALHLGMLRYGQRLKLRELFGRAAREAGHG